MSGICRLLDGSKFSGEKGSRELSDEGKGIQGGQNFNQVDQGSFYLKGIFELRFEGGEEVSRVVVEEERFGRGISRGKDQKQE